MTTTITIDWPCSHDASDGDDAIMQSLEAGYDEGPLIVVPWGRPGRGWGRPAGDALVFADASQYLAHLAMHADEVSGERSVGLVRGSACRNGEAALAALVGLRGQLSGAAQPPRGPGRARRPEPLNYAAYAGTPVFDGEVRVEHVGEGLDDARSRFPAIREGTPQSA
jgi:hypothetical protein